MYTDGKRLKNTSKIMCENCIHKPCSVFIERPEIVFRQEYQ